MNRYNFVLLISILCCIGCVKDKPSPIDVSIPSMQHHGVLICNEGSYSINNSEISYLDLDTKQIYNQLFSVANNHSLGDIAQDIKLINGKFYITINNSNKIVILDAITFKELTTIQGISSPRYILQVSATKAYITSLYTLTFMS